MKKFKKFSLMIVSLVVFTVSVFAIPPTISAKGWCLGVIEGGAATAIFDEKYDGMPFYKGTFGTPQKCAYKCMEENANAFDYYIYTGECRCFH
ncbi:hypothetical protein [Marinifilum sp.]|uniref:hypothetical protein n=1 Tax=Marinifilum sp. TaxID=2033137 RepID=UPI003BACF682